MLTHTLMHTCVHTHTYVYVCMHVHMVCMCVHVAENIYSIFYLNLTGVWWWLYLHKFLIKVFICGKKFSPLFFSKTSWSRSLVIALNLVGVRLVWNCTFIPVYIHQYKEFSSSSMIIAIIAFPSQGTLIECVNIVITVSHFIMA